jgi:DUF4097 and DUF4098 domain-containing protein YvlB
MKAAILVGLLMLSAPTANAQATKSVDRTVVLSPTGAVTLETHNGSIDVRTWDRSEIQIRARIEAAGTSTADVRRFDQTTVDIQSTSDAVSIRSAYPVIASWWWFGNNPRIDYTITAPKTVRWKIFEHNATVDIRGVHAPLTVETHNGRVNVWDLDGPLRVDAHNGTVAADLVSFQGAEFTSHLGSVELTLPSTTAFNLHADTRRGGVQSDFPLTVRTLGRRRQTAVDGAVNGGGPTLRFNSHRGELRLRRKT